MSAIFPPADAERQATLARSVVSEATWARESGSEPPAPRAPAIGRHDALVQATVMVVVGCVFYFGLARRTTAIVVWALAALIAVLGTMWPAAYALIRRGGRWLGRCVGTVLVHLLLVPFFGLCAVPASVLLKLRRRDPLQRRWRDSRHTYWIARAPKDPTDNVTRQFLREDRAAREALRDVADGSGSESATGDAGS